MYFGNAKCMMWGHEGIHKPSEATTLYFEKLWLSICSISEAATEGVL